MQEHQRLLRAAFVAHGGHEVDTQGDSFFVAFASARDALLAAVEGQLALSSHRWPEGVQVKVRMGLHTGQVVASGDRYTGLAVHRAARIGAAGHGGQVLVSQATQTLLEDEEEDLHVSLRDLGKQQLKGLDRAVRVYQAEADGLPDEFPSLRHDAEPAPAAAGAIQPAVWRRPRVLAAAAIILAVFAAAAVLATRDSPEGLPGISVNAVGVIDPATNRIVAEIPVGIRPGPIAAGAGSVWVGNLQDRTLTRIDTEQRSVAATITLESRTPTGVAVGAGAVWVAHGLRGQLSRVDLQFDQVTNTIDIAGQGSAVRGGSVAVGLDSVWVVFGDSTLANVDPTSVAVSESGFAGATPTGIVVAGGAVWVANFGEATAQLFSPTTFPEGPIRTITVGLAPAAIAAGEGAIWVASSGGDAVSRIDPGTSSAVTIPVGAVPAAVAVGEGAVWVANSKEGTVSRVDPTTNEVVETIELGNAPSGIAVAAGFIWVTVQAP